MSYLNKVIVAREGIFINDKRVCSIQNAMEYLRGTIISTLDIRIDISDELRAFLLSRIRM